MMTNNDDPQLNSSIQPLFSWPKHTTPSPAYHHPPSPLTDPSEPMLEGPISPTMYLS